MRRAALTVVEVMDGKGGRGAQTRLQAALVVLGAQADAADGAGDQKPTAEVREARVLELVAKAMNGAQR